MLSKIAFVLTRKQGRKKKTTTLDCSNWNILRGGGGHNFRVLPAAAVTFVAAVHAHHASVRTHVALHALHSRLAGAQARHLLAVVAHRARGVAVARCRTERKRERKKEIKLCSIFKLKATAGAKRTQHRAHFSAPAT